MTQADLRARIGFVPQKAVLFTGTVASNIRFGREDATDEEVRHAAAVAQAVEFIDAHAGRLRLAGLAGRHQPVGRPEAAAGDRPRAGAARRRSTSSTTASRRSTSPPTPGCAPRSGPRPPTPPCSSSSQRISTVMNADRIVVLDDGRVAGIGTHAELLETCDGLPRDRRVAGVARGGRMSGERTVARGRRRRPAGMFGRGARWAASACRSRRPRTSRARCAGCPAISRRTGRR